MKHVKKYCYTIKEAENYHDILYDKYSHVRLIIAPLIPKEEGLYIWEVFN